MAQLGNEGELLGCAARDDRNLPAPRQPGSASQIYGRDHPSQAGQLRRHHCRKHRQPCGHYLREWGPAGGPLAHHPEAGCAAGRMIAVPATSRHASSSVQASKASEVYEGENPLIVQCHRNCQYNADAVINYSRSLLSVGERNEALRRASGVWPDRSSICHE